MMAAPAGTPGAAPMLRMSSSSSPRPSGLEIGCPGSSAARRPIAALTRYLSTGFTLAQMKTGEVAEMAGVNLQTLRYYERRGLLPEPPRRESGYRIYGPEAVRIVRFIKRAQQLGFSLDKVESLLDLAAGGPEGCDAAQELAQHRIQELDRRIADLRAMRDSLDRLVTTCSMPRPERECPLLQCIGSNCPGPEPVRHARVALPGRLSRAGCR
jgi:DNA-binding transcriptional MerR regulator